VTGHLTTAETEQLVAHYLRDLDAALTRLPREAAAELRQQIVDHLNDSIGPNSDEAHVTAVLQRLGTPADLVAESLEIRPRRHWPTLRWRWQRWVTLGVVIAALGSGTGYVVDMATQPALGTLDTTSGWYYAADMNDAHNEDNASGDETITRQRPGDEQGFAFIVDNTSAWPETILGAYHESGLGNNFQSPVTLALGTHNANRDLAYRTDHYVATPAVIPPGQSR
jgi:hypothetical protein